MQEIKFGDNDTLSAITAAMVQADYLFLMTDVDCLYDKNPRSNPDAQAIEVVEDISSLAADVTTTGSSLGTGGMYTKIVAARLATSAGVMTIITRSSKPGQIVNIVNYVQALKQTNSNSPSLPLTPSTEESLSRSTSYLTLNSIARPPLHTRFLPDPHPIRDRSFWLLHGLAPHGTIYIDEGAHRALVNKAGLLPAGVVEVFGNFAQQEAVRLVVVKRLGMRPSSGLPKRPLSPLPNDSSSREEHEEHEEHEERSDTELYETMKPLPIEVGRALVNYSSAEVSRIKGVRSTEIENLLGYAESDYIALRENISLMKTGKGSGGVTPTKSS